MAGAARYLTGDAISNNRIRHAKSDETILAIRNDYSSGNFTMTDLSLKYKVSLSGISLIVRNKRRPLTSSNHGV